MKVTTQSRRRSVWLLTAGLVVFMAFIIYRSLHVAGYRCTLCVSFHGEDTCRTVEGPTEHEARNGAMTNACAYLAAGVTDRMACARTHANKAAVAPTRGR